MHFGKQLDREMVPQWRVHYLDFKQLKRQIKSLQLGEHEGFAALVDLSSNGNSPMAGFTKRDQRRQQLLVFQQVLEKELKKASTFAWSKTQELQTRIMQLLKDSHGTSLSADSDVTALEASWFQVNSEAQQVADELVHLDKFIRQNLTALRKIIKKFDKQLQFDSGLWLMDSLTKDDPLATITLDPLLIALSDVFEQITQMKIHLDKVKNGSKSNVSDNQEPGISAQSFERKTTKYWVSKEDLMAIQVAIIQVN